MTSSYSFGHSKFCYYCSILIGWNFVKSDFTIRCPIERENLYYLPICCGVSQRW